MPPRQPSPDPPRGDARDSSGGYLGVPEGYTVTRGPSPAVSGDSRAEALRRRGMIPAPAGHRWTPTEVEPRYTERDIYTPVQMSPGALMELQRRMAAAGLLTEGYRAGLFDEPTRKAYEALLSYANQYGVSDDEMLNMLLSHPGAEGPDGGAGGGAGGMGLEPEPPPLVHRLPNREDLRRSFRDLTIQLTGEGWSRDEIDPLIDTYYQRLRDEQRNLHNITLANQGFDSEFSEGGEFTEAPSPEAFVEAQIRNRDPLAIPAHDMLGFAQDALQFLGSPAWGT